MTTARCPVGVEEFLDQLAEAGVFFLTLSGEVLMRMDFFDILSTRASCNSM